MNSKDIITIQRLDQADFGQVGQVADLYAKVFAGPPWNETTRCPTTSSFYGEETQVGSPCPDCRVPLLEAYPRDETVKYILGELGKTNPIGLLAFVNSELAGFSWGYQTRLDDLVSSTKWKTPEMRSIVKDLLTSYGVKISLFYGSETGIDPKYRGKGLGKKLVNARFKKIIDSGENYALVRTNVNSPMYGIIKGGRSKGLDGFFQILGPISNQNFFTGNWSIKKRRDKTVYSNNIVDRERPERVLFLFDRSLYNRIQNEPTPGQLMSGGW